jgi:hypothetical protein
MTNPAYRGSVIKIISIALAFWLVLAGGAAAAPLVVGYSAVTSVFLPFWIGKENGFYKKERRCRYPTRVHRQLDDHGAGDVCAPGGHLDGQQR